MAHHWRLLARDVLNNTATSPEVNLINRVSRDCVNGVDQSPYVYSTKPHKSYSKDDIVCILDLYSNRGTGKTIVTIWARH